MRKTRQQQTGYVYKKGNAWYLRYRENVVDDNGLVQRVQRCRKLADAVGRNRSRDAAEGIAQEFLKPLNDGAQTTESSMMLGHFIEQVYLPYVEAQKEPSTQDGYNDMWLRYIKPRADVRPRDVRTFEVERMLRDIAANFDLCRTMLIHIKHFLGGVFTYARRVGVLNGPNPVRDAEVPKARPPAETHACTLEEIIAYLKVVPEPGATLVATAAFTGVRKSELRALRWESFNGQEIKITQKA